MLMQSYIIQILPANTVLVPAAVVPEKLGPFQLRLMLHDDVLLLAHYYDVRAIFCKNILYKIIFQHTHVTLTTTRLWLVVNFLAHSIVIGCYFFGTLDCHRFIFSTPTWPKRPLVNVYMTTVFRGCHSFSDIDMANVMLNNPEYCYYNPAVGMQNTSDKSDEATSPTGCYLSMIYWLLFQLCYVLLHWIGF